MTADEVDAFIASEDKTLDAYPVWRVGNRAGEMRTSLPIAVAGSQAPVSLEMTVRLADPDYLMALLLVSKRVICRLCTATEHFDRVRGELINGSHFHPWPANRPAGQGLPKKLRHYVRLPASVVGKDISFAWFLHQNGIDSPPWTPGGWPLGGTLL